MKTNSYRFCERGNQPPLGGKSSRMSFEIVVLKWIRCRRAAV